MFNHLNFINVLEILCLKLNQARDNNLMRTFFAT